MFCHVHFGLNVKEIKMSSHFPNIHDLWTCIVTCCMWLVIVLRLSIEMVSFGRFLKAAYALLPMRSHKACHLVDGWKNKNRHLTQCLKAVNYFINVVDLAFTSNPEIFSLCFWEITTQAMYEQHGKRISEISRDRWCAFLHLEMWQ